MPECLAKVSIKHVNKSDMPGTTMVDVTKSHACHANETSMSPSATRLPGKTTVDVAKCHACYAQCRGVTARPRGPKRATRASPVSYHKCHACHAKRKSMSPSATPARQDNGRCRQVPRLPRKVLRRHRATKGPQARHQSQPSAITATLATRNEGRCRQAPRMPRKTKVHVRKRHACHAKCRGVTARPRGPKRATRASPVP